MMKQRIINGFKNFKLDEKTRKEANDNILTKVYPHLKNINKEEVEDPKTISVLKQK